MLRYSLFLSFQFSFGNLAGGRYRFLIQELFSEPEEQELEAGSSIVLNLNTLMTLLYLPGLCCIKKGLPR